MKITLIDPLNVDDSIIVSHKNKLEEKGHEFDYYKESAKSDQEIIKRLKDSDIAIITNKKFSKEVIENTNLELIDVAFTGTDHVAVDFANEKGIVVENASGYSDQSVAELVIGLAIDIMRKFDENRENIFENKNHFLLGDTLKSKKIGIIGTGNIGKRTIELFKAFGCEIIAYSRTQKEEIKNLGVKYVQLDQLLKEADIISIHLPLNSHTKGFLSKEKLDLIRDDAILINCARGPIIDNDHLAKLLNEGKIRAAGIDVFDMEPPLDSNYPLRNAKNVVLTNHVAFFTNEAMENRAEIVFDNIYKFLDGSLQNVVN